MESNGEEFKLELPCEEKCECLVENTVIDVVGVEEQTETVEKELVFEEEQTVGDEKLESTQEQEQEQEQEEQEEEEEEEIVGEDSELGDEEPDSDGEQNIVVTEEPVVESVAEPETVSEVVTEEVVVDFTKETEQKPVAVQQPSPIPQQRQPYINRLLRPVGHHLKRFKFF